jgi:hypothetical protein
MPETMPLISVLLVEDLQVTLDVLSIIFAKKYPRVVFYAATNGRLG